MKLRKDKWTIGTLSQMCDVRDGTHDSPKYVMSNGIPLITQKNITEKGLSFDDVRFISKEDHKKICIRSNVGYGDIILSMIGENRGMSCIINDNRVFSIKNVGLIKFTNQDKLLNQYLISVLQSGIYRQKLEAKATGTAQKFISLSAIRSFEIPIPSIEEQKQIASLFQSIETAMEQVDGQEKNLKALWQRLIDEFVSPNPQFGNLVIKKKMKSFLFSEVTEKVTRRIDPFSKGIKRRIGGEDFISSDLKLRTWGEVGKDYVGPAFHMHVLPGDILYVSRNSHLRKVAYADFEGVCSNTTYVVQSNEKHVLQNLMKHIMLSEGFTKYAMSVTKGSTNPYLNWKDLDNFSFQAPDLETQREIANVLDDVLAIVEQLKQQKTTLKNLKGKLLNEILG